MEGANRPFKIAIIGGGLSGLGVAKGLLEAEKKVNVTVYERREDDSAFSKFPIRISPEGREALRYLLSAEEYSHLLKETDHGINHGGISIYTERFDHLFSIRKWEDDQPQFAHRWVLAQAVSAGIEVQRGKRVIRVREMDDKKVEVVFDNATVERVDLVIGADGLGSTLRAQLHPQHSKVPLMPYLVVQFKLLTPLSKFPNLKPDGANMIIGKSSYSLLLTPFHGKSVPKMPHNVDINPFTDHTEFETTLKALDEPCPEYIFGAFGLPSFTGWEDLTPQSWITKVAMHLTKDGADKRLVRAVLNDIVPQSVGAWQITSFDADDMIPWKGGRCVLIGDAAHAIPPQGGVGGSIAMKDAEHLVKVLLSSEELGGGDGSIDRLLPSFHAEMVTRASACIRDAKRRLGLSHKSGWAVYWQRALLRVMNLVSPFALWVLSRGRLSFEPTKKKDKHV